MPETTMIYVSKETREKLKALAYFDKRPLATYLEVLADDAMQKYGDWEKVKAKYQLHQHIELANLQRGKNADGS